MKTSIMKQSWYGFSLALSVVSAFSVTTFSQTANAAVFNVGQLSWDSDNSVNSGKVIEGNVSALPASFLIADPNVDLINNQTIGSVIGLGGGFNTFAALGNQIDRAIIELSWAGKYLKNYNGDDFVLYENGFVGEPEAFAVAIRKTGETTFSNYFYKFTKEFVPTDISRPDVGGAFATVFDLTDFNLGQNEAIDAIRVMNLLPSDRVEGNDGQGFLGGSFLPLTGVGGTEFALDKFDPDITYLVALNQPTSVPEPSAILGFLLLGGIGLAKKLIHK